MTTESRFTVEQDRAMARASVLLEKLVTAKHPEQIAALHKMLMLVAPLAGFEAPCVDSFLPSPGRPPGEALRERFWLAISELRDRHVEVDHSISGAVEAFNLKAIIQQAAEVGFALGSLVDLREAIQRDPRFIDSRNIKSRLTGKAVRCHRFTVDDT